MVHVPIIIWQLSYTHIYIYLLLYILNVSRANHQYTHINIYLYIYLLHTGNPIVYVRVIRLQLFCHTRGDAHTQPILQCIGMYRFSVFWWELNQRGWPQCLWKHDWSVANVSMLHRTPPTQNLLLCSSEYLAHPWLLAFRIRSQVSCALKAPCITHIQQSCNTCSRPFEILYFEVLYWV